MQRGHTRKVGDAGQKGPGTLGVCKGLQEMLKSGLCKCTHVGKTKNDSFSSEFGDILQTLLDRNPRK